MEKKDNRTLAWHFVGDTLRDGRPIPEDGETLTHDGPIRMCESGLHASTKVLDALHYAPGHTLCRVRLWGELEGHGTDKVVGRNRLILWRMDVEDLLREFARKCVLDVIDLWDAPPVVRQWLGTGDEGLRKEAHSAARSAAYSATDSAARSAANSAANSAADSAADSAAWSAASSAADSAADLAADSAAWSAAYSAVCSAARETQNRRLTAMVTHARRKQDPNI